MEIKVYKNQKFGSEDFEAESCFSSDTISIQKMKIFEKAVLTLDPMKGTNIFYIISGSVSFQCGEAVNIIDEGESILFKEHDSITLNVISKTILLMISSASIRNEDDDYEAIKKITREVEEKDPYTKYHNYRVCLYASALLSYINPKIKNEYLSEAANFHDVGKINTPSEILNKPSSLTRKEYEIIKQHPVDSYKILKEHNVNDEVCFIVLHHHERLDGSGYPDGLTGDQIPFETRILSVADVFDAITSDRPYHKAKSFEKALEIMETIEKDRLDQSIVKALKQLVLKGIIYPHMDETNTENN